MKISCIQGRIESLLPPNVDPGSTLSSLNGAFIGGLTGSMLWFVTKYSRDYQALFTYDSVLRKKTLVAGARIAPFTDYEGCALWLLVYCAIIAAVWAVLLWLVYNVLGNVSFIVIQRYNRPRLQKLAEKTRRKPV